MSERKYTPEELEGEVWKDIPGREGYQVSSVGRVRTQWTAGRWRKMSGEWRAVNQVANARGYLQVSMSNRRYLVHCLVLEAFVGPRPSDGRWECCHADDKKNHNVLSNLSWGTSKQNKADAKRNGISNCGERHGLSKITDEQAMDIRRRAATGELLRLIAADFGINDNSVGRIACGRRFSHLPGALPRRKAGAKFGQRRRRKAANKE